MKAYFRDGRGVTAVEYGLLICLMTVVVVGGISSLGQQVWTQLFQKVANSL